MESTIISENVKDFEGPHDPFPDGSRLDAALWYARLGFLVFPVHGIRDKECTCGRGPRCEHSGKHPRTLHGLSDATTDQKQIQEWWRMWPDANIGVRTGPESGVWVLDVDGDEGQTSLEALEREHGPLPKTWGVKTGRGEHIYFAWPADGTIQNSIGKLGRGLDIRATGGYVIAPPSQHASGAVYQWITDEGGL